MSKNASGADNQQETKLRLNVEGVGSSETIRRAPLTRSEILAYVHGAMHDGSLNKRNRVRIVQRYNEWLEMIHDLLQTIGIHSWVYREGKVRNLYVLETVSPELDFKFNPLRLRTKQEQVMYLRGFFDAEGGVPRNGKRFYIQLAQKDYAKMSALKEMLGELSIESGKIHNPSKRVDPDYWRIFVLAKHHHAFAARIGSWHPVKSKILEERMKI